MLLRVLSLLALLLLPAWAFAQDDDRGFLTGLIEDNLSSTARQVQIEGFEGALSSRASIERLTIADAEGIWLDARNLVLDWNRSALLRGRIEVEELSAGSIEVLRAPVAEPQANVPSPEATPFSLPELPVSVQIGDLQAGSIVLGEPLLGRRIELNLDGSVSLADGEGEADVQAQIVEGGTGTLDLHGAYSNDTRVLDLSLDLSESEGGLLASVLDLPGRPSVDLSLQGTGPIDDYQASLTLATGGEQRVEGTFGLVSSDGQEGAEGPDRAFTLALSGDVTTLVAPDTRDFFGPDVRVSVEGSRGGDGSLSLTDLTVAAQAIDLTGEAELTPEGWPERLRLQGRIGTDGGAPVALPATEDLTVGSVTLDVAYDEAQGDAWTGEFAIADLARPGLTVPSLTLSGSGTIVPAEDGTPGTFTGDLSYDAEGLAFEDEGLSDALGADIRGDISLARDEGAGPLRIRTLTVEGPGVEASLEGTVGGPGSGYLAQTSLILQADDLARFAALAGLDLGGAADLTLVSAVRPLDGIFDVSLQGDTQDLSLGIDELDPLLQGAGTLRLEGSRDEGGTRIDTLDIATPAASITGEATITSGESRAQLDLDVTDLGLSVPTLSGPATVSVTATRDSVGLVRLDADADLPGATLAVTASQPGATEDDAGNEVRAPITLAASVDAEALGDFAPLVADLAPGLGLSPEGAARIDVAGTTAQDASTFDLAVSADTDGLALGLPRVDPLLAGEGRVSGRAVRTGPLDLRIEGLTVRTDLVTADVTAGFEDGQGSADLDVALSDVAPLLDGLSGPARVTGTARTVDGGTQVDLDATLPGGTASVEGTVAPPAGGFAFDGTADVQVTDLSPYADLLGRPLGGSVDATAEGTLRPDLSALDLQVDAQGQDLRLGIPQVDPLLAGASRVQGTVSRAQDGSADVDLTATLAAGTARVDGTVAAPADGQAFTGEVAVNLPDLSPLSGLAGRDLGGALRGTANGTVQPDLSVLDLTFDATTQDLRVGLPQVAPLLAGAGTLSGRVQRSPEAGISLDVTADTPLLDATVDGTLGDDEGTARFDVTVADVAPLAPGLSGEASAAGTATRAADGSLAVTLDATAPGATASVDATVAPPEDGYEVSGTADLRVADLAPWSRLAGQPLGGGLDATVSGTLLPSLDRFDLQVDATARSLDPGVPALAPVLAGEGTVQGRVVRDEAGLRAQGLQARFPNFSATADATVADGATTTRFDARLADVGLLTPALSGPATATGTATIQGGTTRIDASATGPGGIRAQVEGTVGGADTDLSVTGTAPLSLANGILEPRVLEGTAAFDLRARGELSPEALSGTVRLDGARLSDPSLGQALTGISGTVTLGGGQAQVALGGGLLSGGRIEVAGPVGLADPYQADLTVTATGLVLRDPSLYEAQASGRVTVRGPLAGGAVIAGAVDIAEAEVRVPSSAVGALGDLPEVRQVDPSPAVRQTLARAGVGTDGRAAGGTGTAGGASSGGSGGYGLDVTVSAPARVFIRGRGLDAELGGQLRLTGTTNAIVPVGAFNLLRGRLDLLGQRFDLTEGSATLQGDFVPIIRLVAETTARTGTAITIVVEGPATDPEVTFSSSPDLPEDEVLAQLLFGVDLASITPFQAVQLASSVATLAGRGGGLVDSLRGDAGLADLDITTDESGNAALRLGKYLGENVYTDVTVSTAATEGTINLDLTPDLTVRAGVSSDGGTSVGIEFARDY